jgi:hypothetical protein
MKERKRHGLIQQGGPSPHPTLEHHGEQEERGGPGRWRKDKEMSHWKRSDYFS